MLPAGVVVLADVGSGSGAAAAVACTFALGQGKGLVALRLARPSLSLLASPTSLDFDREPIMEGAQSTWRGSSLGDQETK